MTDKQIASNDSWKIDFTGMTWWDKFAQAGDPDCKCSLCLKLIEEDDCPVLFWTQDGKKVVRLHDKCFMRRAELKSETIKL